MPQTVRLEKNRCNFTLAGDDVQPPAVEMRAASPTRQRRYWELLRDAVHEIKDDALAKGFDARGRKIRKVRPESREPYRRAGLEWTGPGLMPQRELSRTRRYFRVMVYPQARPTSVIGYWLNKWSRILGFHARGEVKGAPVRDVVGLSAKQIEKAVETAIRRWRSEAPARPARAAAASKARPQPPRPIAASPAKPLTATERAVAQKYPEIGRYLRPPRPQPRAR